MTPYRRRRITIGLCVVGVLSIAGITFWALARPRPPAEALTILIGHCGGDWDGQPYSRDYRIMLRDLPDTLGRQSLIGITLDDIQAYDYDDHRFLLAASSGSSIQATLRAANEEGAPTAKVLLCYLGLVNHRPRFAGVLAGTLDASTEFDAPHVGELHIWEKDGFWFGQIAPFDNPSYPAVYSLDMVRNWWGTPDASAPQPTEAPYGTDYYAMVVPNSPELYQVLRDSGKLTSLVWP